MSINNYFSPVGKRNRSNTSPEQLSLSKRLLKCKEDQNMADINKIMEQLEVMLDNKLSALASKEDIKSVMNQLKVLQDENLGLKNEIILLKKHSEEMEAKLVDLEDRNRRNNLIFKGLKCSVNDDAVKIVKNFCENMLGVKDVWINRAHVLGKAKTGGPVIAHVPNDTDISYIFKNARKLKGTDYIVHRDYSKITRYARGRLFAIKKEVKKINANKQVYVLKDSMVIEGVSFKVKDDKFVVDGGGDGFSKLSSLLEQDVMELRDRIFKSKDNTRKADED